MNSDSIFLCASWSFAYDWKGEKCPGKFGMCQMCFLIKVTPNQGWGKAWPLWFNCTEAGRYENDSVWGRFQLWEVSRRLQLINLFKPALCSNNKNIIHSL